MGMRITLTFKDSEKWLYDEIMKHSGKGNWIKDVLAESVKGPAKAAPLPVLQKTLIDDDFGILGGL